VMCGSSEACPKRNSLGGSGSRPQRSALTSVSVGIYPERSPLGLLTPSEMTCASRIALIHTNRAVASWRFSNSLRHSRIVPDHSLRPVGRDPR
jgi:hypothetical protein